MPGHDRVVRRIARLKLSHNRFTCHARDLPDTAIPSTHPTLREADMLEQMTARLDFHGQSLNLRAQRQQLLASNIANADTPGYVARDFDFAQALKNVTAAPARDSVAVSDVRHLPMRPGLPRSGELAYAVQTQPSQDRNTVDLDRERANFVDNSVRYESTLRFINGHVKTMLSAITGQ